MIHLQYGLAQAGQRDLLIAALLVAAYAALSVAQERSLGGAVIGICGLLIGATGTIKPLLLPLGVLLVLLSTGSARRRGVGAVRHCLCGFLGLLAPFAVALSWLQRKGSLPAFLATVTSLIPYYAQLGRRPVAYLLTHPLSPVMPLVVIWLGLLAVR